MIMIYYDMFYYLNDINSGYYLYEYIVLLLSLVDMLLFINKCKYIHMHTQFIIH